MFPGHQYGPGPEQYPPQPPHPHTHAPPVPMPAGAPPAYPPPPPLHYPPFRGYPPPFYFHHQHHCQVWHPTTGQVVFLNNKVEPVAANRSREARKIPIINPSTRQPVEIDPALAKKKVVYPPPAPKEVPSAMPLPAYPMPSQVSTGENLGGETVEVPAEPAAKLPQAVEYVAAPAKEDFDHAPKVGNTGTLNLDDMGGRLEDALKLLRGGPAEGGLNLNLCDLAEEIHVPEPEPVKEVEPEPEPEPEPAKAPIVEENILPAAEPEEEAAPEPVQEVPEADAWPEPEPAAEETAELEEEAPVEQEAEAGEQEEAAAAAAAPAAPKWTGWGKPAGPSALVNMAATGQPRKVVMAAKPAAPPVVQKKTVVEKAPTVTDKSKKEEEKGKKEEEKGKAPAPKGSPTPAEPVQAKPASSPERPEAKPSATKDAPAWPSQSAWGAKPKAPAAAAAAPKPTPKPAPAPAATGPSWGDEEEDESPPEVTVPMPGVGRSFADRVRLNAGPQHTMRSQMYEQQQLLDRARREKEAALRAREQAEKLAEQRSKEEEKARQEAAWRIEQSRERRAKAAPAAGPGAGAPAASQPVVRGFSTPAAAPEPQVKKPKPEIMTADGWGVVLSKKTARDLADAIAHNKAPNFVLAQDTPQPPEAKKSKGEAPASKRAAPEEAPQSSSTPVKLTEEQLKPYRNKVRNLMKKLKDIEALKGKTLTEDQQQRMAALPQLKKQLAQAEADLKSRGGTL